MEDHSLTLRLSGDVTVAMFADATERWHRVLNELATAHGAPGLDWVLTDLSHSSAILTAAPIPRPSDDPHLTDDLAADYLSAARQVHDHPAVLDRPVLRLVHDLATKATSSDHEVIFETADDEVAFLPGAPRPQPPQRRQPVLGTIRGRIQTLQQRKGLRFMLYDLVNDKAITCYLAEDQQEHIRQAWGRVAEVTGLVTRDEITDIPRSIRRITDLRLLPDGDAFDFRRARGAIPAGPEDPPAEVLIRQVRDAI